MQVFQEDLNDILARAEADLRTLKHARLFVTGGTGYIGRWLLAALCQANRVFSLDLQMTVLSRNPQSFKASDPEIASDPAIGWLQGDVLDFTPPSGTFTHVLHAATDVIATNTPLDTFDVTVAGTRRVLDFSQACGATRFLLLSSGAVYGRIPHEMDLVPETFRGAPDVGSTGAAYGIGKLASEWLCNTYATQGGAAAVSARIFAQLGPFLALDKQFAAGNFILDALEDRPFVIRGDGTPRRSYMYATDLVVWLLAIFVRGHSGQSYNVGSDQAISIRDLAERVAQVADLASPEIQVFGVAQPGTPPERYVPAIDRARDELGLEIAVSLDQGLRRTIDWYRPRFSRATS
ncbi:NAD-dependent epimerase/dehydratase family protein [Pandoraea sputorum]|uniref:NAD-dependent epimerase/dehydratase family protein n=1 Tax=Pandoraea sputorum TaxID=93222 RepID=UPI002AF6BCF1|nr:NAD(P)-dependent oxidoreductase [Pandoraea sputorum]